METKRIAEKSPRDLKAVLDAERQGHPFLVLRDADGAQQLITLDEARPELVVGREPESDICLAWDPRVSALHARLQSTHKFWVLHDDGLSRNGSFLNGERVYGHRVLSDRDELRFGHTVVLFRDPSPRTAGTVAASAIAGPQISPAQRKVLVALCRQYKHRPAFARPATNKEIAEELFLSVEAVKSHLRVLFEKCGLDAAPQSEKRVRLVEHALSTGLVSDHEL